MDRLAEFSAFIRRGAPLAPYTHLGLGGPAEMLAEPRTPEELSALVGRCYAEGIPFRVLGSGCNLLVRDEGVPGVVLRLVGPAFTTVTVDPARRRARAGTGASVSALIVETTRRGLTGLEALVGIAGTIGGALRTNAGDRTGDIGQFVGLVEVLDGQGRVQVRERDELQFGPHVSNLDDPVLLTAEFALEPDDADAIVKRLRKAWIVRKATQPTGDWPAGRLFRDPPGLRAAALIEQAGLARARSGGAEVNERDANYAVVHAGAASADVLALMDLIQLRVRERFNVALEPEIAVW